MVGIFLVGLEISSETAALADSQQAFYEYPIDVQVFWLQGKACVILPPDGYISTCSFVPLIPVMVALTLMFVAVLVVLGLLRKRVNLLPTKRTYPNGNDEHRSSTNISATSRSML